MKNTLRQISVVIVLLDYAIVVNEIIPTYNERENIVSLVPAIFDALEKAGIAGEVIIVDDSSPDGTADVAEEMGSRIREVGDEYGATTGRPRRCGWFIAHNGVDFTGDVRQPALDLGGERVFHLG
jgi:glycosyltransferase involved in cell wall biosynthesis